jgi:hypothetical protein
MKFFIGGATNLNQKWLNITARRSRLNMFDWFEQDNNAASPLEQDQE